MLIQHLVQLPAEPQNIISHNRNLTTEILDIACSKRNTKITDAPPAYTFTRCSALRKISFSLSDKRACARTRPGEDVLEHIGDWYSEPETLFRSSVANKKLELTSGYRSSAD